MAFLLPQSQVRCPGAVRHFLCFCSHYSTPLQLAHPLPSRVRQSVYTPLLRHLQAKMGIKIKVLDPTPNCPASVVAEQVVGSFRDPEAVKAFAQGVDVLTVEIEHIDADAMEASRGGAATGWGGVWVGSSLPDGGRISGGAGCWSGIQGCKCGTTPCWLTNSAAASLNCTEAAG